MSEFFQQSISILLQMLNTFDMKGIYLHFINIFSVKQDFFILCNFLVSYFSLFGLSFALNQYFKLKNIFLSIFIILNLICLLLFFTLFINSFFIIATTTKLLGILFLAQYSINYFFKFNIQEYKKIFEKFLFLKVLLFVFPLYFLIYQYNMGFVGFDTFFHGMFSKSINMHGSFWNKDSLIAPAHIRSLPYFYILQNYFLYPGLFQESVAVASGNVLWVCSIGALIFHSNKFKKNTLLLIIILLISLVGLHGPFLTLTMEGYIAISLTVLLYFLSIDLSLKIRLALLIVASGTILMKELSLVVLTQIFLISFAVSIYDFTRDKFLTKNFQKTILLHFFAIFLTIFLYLIFNSQFLDIEYGRNTISELSFSSSLKQIMDRFNFLLPYFIDGIFNKNIYIQGDANRHFHMFAPSGFLYSLGGLYLILSLSIITLYRSNKIEKFLILFIFNIGYLANLALLFIVFAFGMGVTESQQLSSFERYNSIFVLVNILFITFKIFENRYILWQSKKFKYFCITNIQVLLICVLYLFCINGFIASKSFWLSHPDNLHVINIKKSHGDFINYYKNSNVHNKNNETLLIVSGDEHLRSIQLGFMMAPNYKWPLFAHLGWSRESKDKLISENNLKHIFLVGYFFDETGIKFSNKIENELKHLSILGYKKHIYTNNYIHLIKEN